TAPSRPSENGHYDPDVHAFAAAPAVPGRKMLPHEIGQHDCPDPPPRGVAYWESVGAACGHRRECVTQGRVEREWLALGGFAGAHAVGDPPHRQELEADP